jgi:hypothetical protein
MVLYAKEAGKYDNHATKLELGKRNQNLTVFC